MTLIMFGHVSFCGAAICDIQKGTKRLERARPPDFWPAAMGGILGSAVPAVEHEKTKWVPCLHLCVTLLLEGRGLIKKHRGTLVSSTEVLLVERTKMVQTKETKRKGLGRLVMAPLQHHAPCNHTLFRPCRPRLSGRLHTEYMKTSNLFVACARLCPTHSTLHLKDVLDKLK